jgi:lipopolysaccharide export system ATP-binding protein
VLEPSLLLLDEPFAGVDPIAVQDIQAILRRLRAERGISILLTDHNVRETLSVTDRSYIIAEGKILRHGVPSELVNDEVVRRTYLGEGFSMPELGT